MEKKLYSKPFMSVEQFTPSEYVATCWCIPEGACFTSLYHDEGRGWYGNNYNEEHDSDENNLGHASHAKKVFNTEDYPKPTSSDNINDSHYWANSSTETHWFIVQYYTYPYNNKISGNIF